MSKTNGHAGVYSFRIRSARVSALKTVPRSFQSRGVLQLRKKGGLMEKGLQSLVGSALRAHRRLSVITAYSAPKLNKKELEKYDYG